MGRMNFLIVLETLILKIPLGIVKNVEFYDGFSPVFCTQDQDLDYMSLTARTKICTNDVRLRYARATPTLRTGSQVFYLQS